MARRALSLLLSSALNTLWKDRNRGLTLDRSYFNFNRIQDILNGSKPYRLLLSSIDVAVLFKLNCDPREVKELSFWDPTYKFRSNLIKTCCV